EGFGCWILNWSEFRGYLAFDDVHVSPTRIRIDNQQVSPTMRFNGNRRLFCELRIPGPVTDRTPETLPKVFVMLPRKSHCGCREPLSLARISANTFAFLGEQGCS